MARLGKDGLEISGNCAMKRFMDTWQGSANVRSYECDASGLMRPESLLHWIQDAAETHAAALGWAWRMGWLGWKRR